MDSPLRIAQFVGMFPVASETFIARQVAGLIDLGHEVEIYSDVRGDCSGAVPTEVTESRLLERTTFMDLPPECAPWELPAWPEDGETWLPGSSVPIPNRQRLTAMQAIRDRCAQKVSGLTLQVLDESNYGYRARSLSALHRLDRLVNRPGRYDILHAHFGPVGESFRFTRELWSAPLVVSFHGYDFCSVPRREGANCYARLFATADMITVNSEYSRRQVEQLGCPPSKISKLPMGLDPRKFPFRERQLGDDRNRPVRLLTVARLVEVKGHEFALRALAEVRRQRPDLRFHYDLVGDGPLRVRLETLRSELGMEDSVTFHGSQTGLALTALYERADLFLLTSVNVAGDEEGQGLVLMEAQACGLPVVATRHGAFPEGVLDGVTGWLVPERDVLALAAQLLRSIDSAAHWPAMGATGRRWVESNYNLNLLSQELAELYRRTIHSHRSARETKNPETRS